MEDSLSSVAPVALARPRGAHRFEAFSPKLDRRVMFYRRACLEQWVLIEADPSAIEFCVRPGYVHVSERKCIADFWVRYADRQELILLVDRGDVACEPKYSGDLNAALMPVRYVPRVEHVTARTWIDNWQRMLPCIIATRKLVSSTTSAAIERFVRRPQKLVAIEREFSTGDPVLVRAALFCLLHAGRVSAPELRTQPLSLLTYFEGGEASK
jgi:hypothetical protein